ncbi:MAG: hypothetical protein KDD35_09655, partial [Bdellovibrionales bacterium]|nr:hypothetical protein [Bdellovibrionales bacterium]
MIFFLELICLLLIIFAPLKSYGLSEGCPRSAAIEARALRLEIEKEVNSGHIRQGDLFAALVNEVETANGVNPAKEKREKDSVCETLVK